MESMNLIQLNCTELEKLINYDTQFNNHQFISGAIPSMHVLKRSIDLFHQSVDSVWSFPYFIQQDNQIIGCCGFKQPPCNELIEIGYHIAPDARGHGVATLAIEKITQIAFSSGKVKTVIALISSQNKASLNVVLKNGFSYKKSVIDDDDEALECWELNKNSNC